MRRWEELGGRTNIQGKLNNICSGSANFGVSERFPLTEPTLIVFRCACDVPSHNYTWSFEPKLDWSGTYASSKEIFDYFDNFARKYCLNHYCRMRHQVVGATWNSRTNGYDVKVQDLSTGDQFDDYCDILINAGGVLNSWRWPAIPGLESYQGEIVHTANWDQSLVLKGKHVGLIGNG